MIKYRDYSDTDLWNLFIQGNKGVLEIIYKRHYDNLLNYGLKYNNIHKTTVEDCIQDLFIKLYSSKNISPTPYVLAYLLKSLKNLLFDKIEADKGKVIIEQISFDLSVDDLTLNKLFEKSDRDLDISKKLVRVFSSLNQSQKRIIYFKYIKDLSHKEISYLLDINEQSAMNLLSRTILKLRDLILNSKILSIFI